MILYKKNREKRPPIVGNAREQRMFTIMEKVGLDIKNTPGYIQYAGA